MRHHSSIASPIVIEDFGASRCGCRPRRSEPGASSSFGGGEVFGSLGGTVGPCRSRAVADAGRRGRGPRDTPGSPHRPRGGDVPGEEPLMGQAIGSCLPLAVGVALSPVPIIAVVLMLTTPRARLNGPA